MQAKSRRRMETPKNQKKRQKPNELFNSVHSQQEKEDDVTFLQLLPSPPPCLL